MERWLTEVEDIELKRVVYSRHDSMGDKTLPGIMLSVNAVSGSIIDSSKGY